MIFVFYLNSSFVGLHVRWDGRCRFNDRKVGTNSLKAMSAHGDIVVAPSNGYTCYIISKLKKISVTYAESVQAFVGICQVSIGYVIKHERKAMVIGHGQTSLENYPETYG